MTASHTDRHAASSSRYTLDDGAFAHLDSPPSSSPLAADHPATSAMATLTVNTPPAKNRTDPMLDVAITAERHHRSCTDSARSPSPAPCTQSPVATLSSVTSGDGWSIVSKRSEPFVPNNEQRSDHANSQDVPFGERASPAVISLNHRNSRSRGRALTRPPSPLALSPAMVNESPNPSGLHRGGLRGSDEDVDVKETLVHSVEDGGSSSTPLMPPATRKLCVRHQRMADEGTTARLQKSIESLPLADQTAVNTVWSLFSSSSHHRRALILQGMLTMCCFSQLSLLSSELSLAIRIDPFSLFPREVSLKVLGHLDAISLGRTAQVSRSWKQLADDDLLWRNMCEQHIERKCEKCGWGLPLLSERRRRLPGPAAQLGTPESRDLSSDGSGCTNATGSLKRTITAAANAAALEKQSRSRASSPTASSTRSQSRSISAHRDVHPIERTDRDAPPLKKHRSGLNGQATASLQTSAPKTRPWKSVYCERLAIERNWRRGRFQAKTLTGHTDGIMCLQFNENLAHPAFPVIITGSYDRTARIWNLETGEQLRVLEGHTRGVRCLQFDEAKLITGSMDRTLKIWNWRTGALMRTLEGHTEGIVCLHFNEDTLASGSADSNIKVWNFRTGECYTLRGHRDWVNAVTLWTGPAAKERQKRLREALREGQPAPSIDSTAAGTFLFSASDDGSIRLWDLGLRECLLTFEGHVGQVQSLKLVMMDDEALRKLIGGAAGGPGAEGNQGQRFVGPRGPLAQQSGATPAIVQHQDGDQDMMSVEDQESYFLNDANLSPLRRQTPTRDSSIDVAGEASQSCSTASATAPRPWHSAAAIPDRFYDGAGDTHSAERRTALDQPVPSAQRARRRKIDPLLLKVQDRLCEAGLVDPLPLDAEMGDLDPVIVDDAGAVRNEQRNSNSEARSSSKERRSAHSKPRPVLISGSLDNTLKVWDVRTGRCIRTLFGHVEGVWSLDVDKLRIASASHDRTIKIWDRETGFCQNTLVGHKGAVTCVSLSDDKIVSGSDDGDIKVWSFAATQASTNSSRTTPAIPEAVSTNVATPEVRTSAAVPGRY